MRGNLRASYTGTGQLMLRIWLQHALQRVPSNNYTLRASLMQIAHLTVRKSSKILRKQYALITIDMISFMSQSRVLHVVQKETWCKRRRAFLLILSAGGVSFTDLTDPTRTHNEAVKTMFKLLGT